jgi:hypothetical protein
MPEPLHDGDFERKGELFRLRIYRSASEPGRGRRIVVTAPDREECDTQDRPNILLAEQVIAAWLDWRDARRLGSTAEMAVVPITPPGLQDRPSDPTDAYTIDM